MAQRDRARTRALPVLLLAAGLTAAACGGEEPSGQGGPRGRGEPSVIPAVEAVQSQRGALPLRERLTGTVRAAGQVAIYPQSSGPIVEVLAQNGDYVEEGEPLVRIQAPVSRSQLTQARANLSVARATMQQARANLEELSGQFERTQVLAEENLVSAEALETQRAQVQAAQASYARAQAQVQVAEATVAERAEVVGQTVVRAPISGRVGQRNAEVGMQVGPQTALFIIGRLENVRIEVPVSQELLGRLREGQRVEVRAESFPDTVITAEVSRISPFLQEGSYSAEVEVDVPNPSGLLVPGMFVTVDVFYGASDQATLVPASALYEHPITGEEGVFVTAPPAPASPAADGAAPALAPPVGARFQPISVLAEGPQTVGVQGIGAGEWVVVIGQHLLSEQSDDGTAQARVHPIAWERILELQQLQRQDLLREFLEKQERIVRQRAAAAAQGSQS